MATRSLRLVIDTENGRLIPGFRSIVSSINPKFTVGDQVPVEVYLAKASAQTGFTLQEVPFPAGCVLRVALGEINQVPTAGNWNLSFGGDTTADLAHNATADQVETALNALASITAAGGVAVSKVGDAFSVEFNTVGARTPITGNAETLVPLSAVSVQTLQEGSASLREIVFVQVKVRPIALVETFSDIGSPVISRTGQNYSIAGAVKAGSYTLTVTVGASSATTVNIPFNAPASVIQDALSLALDNLNWDNGGQAAPVQVIQNESQSWSISYWDGGSYLTGVNGSNLVGFAGKTGTLSINTPEALAFIGSDATKTATLEVEIEVASERQTLVQTPAAISADVILAGAFEPTSLEEALSEAVANERYVRRDADQTLDTTSKNQIWENLLGSTATTGVNLVDAILAANAPSSSNALATIADIPPSFNQSLNTTDTVIFSAVSATSFNANGESDLSGGIRMTGVGMDTTYKQDEIAFQGTTVLTPTTLALGSTLLDSSSGLTGINYISVFSGTVVLDLTGITLAATGVINFSDGSVQETRVVRENQANGSAFTVGGFDTVHYPYEVKVIDNTGVAYWVPARLA